MESMKTPQDEIKALLANGHTQAELAKAAKAPS
jgi:DNA-binding CsgD family transcriptional regulator